MTSLRTGLQKMRSPAGVLWACVLLVTVLPVTRPVQDPDFWWHLTTGRWILANHAVPHHDLYTFTVPGHLWITHEWLTEIGFALLMKAGGFTAVSLAFAALTLAAWWLIAATAALWGARPYALAAGIYLLGVLSGYPLWGPRAQMLTFLGAAWLSWALTRYRLSGGRDRALWLLPLVMLAWVNLHGGYIVAFVLLGAVLVGESAKRMRGRESALPAPALLDLLLIALFTLLASLVNPNGASILAYPFQTLGSPAQMTFVDEWLSPNFHLLEMRFFEALLLSWLLGLALARRLDLTDALLGLGTLALALQSTRQIELFAAVATPLVIRTWAQAWERLPRRGRRATPPLPLLMALIPVALVAAIMVGRAVEGVLPPAQARAQAPDYPQQTATYLATNPPAGRMFNSYGWGGYLIYRLWPQQRVFIDGSADVMGDALLTDYITVSHLRRGWRQVLSQYRVDYVVYDTDMPLAVALASEPGWRVIHRDMVATLFQRIPSTP